MCTACNLFTHIFVLFVLILCHHININIDADVFQLNVDASGVIPQISGTLFIIFVFVKE